MLRADATLPQLATLRHGRHIYTNTHCRRIAASYITPQADATHWPPCLLRYLLRLFHCLFSDDAISDADFTMHVYISPDFAA